MTDAEKQQILQTLAFFDVVGMPVSFSAVRRWQWGNEVASKKDLLATLDWHAKLGQRATLREEESEALIKKAHPWLRRLCYWPGVQALYLCNSVAFMSANEQSDIDVFIVCKKGQVWATRFILTALLALFGKRPKPGNEAGTICLSFFTDETSLDLSGVALPDGKDIYLAYWLATLAPVYDPTDTEERLLEVNRVLFPNEKINTFRRIRDTQVRGVFVDTMRALCLPLYAVAKFSQPYLKRWQQRRFPSVIIEASKQPNHSVVISNTMLKFHTNDRREAYRLAWQNRYDQLSKMA
jgi:hypothetical protein